MNGLNIIIDTKELYLIVDMLQFGDQEIRETYVFLFSSSVQNCKYTY